MFDLIKKLFHSRHRELTLLVLDDSRPEEDNSFKIKPLVLFLGLTGAALSVILITTLFFMLTPFGSLLYTSQDNQLREQVIQISSRVAALQDSLQRRDTQLNTIKQVMKQARDSVFKVDSRFLGDVNPENANAVSFNFGDFYAYEMMTAPNIIFSEIMEKSPEFPSLYPVNGTLTRGYEPNARHYGIDIATKADEEFKAVADGTVISSGWTVNSGYVIYVQHTGGMLSVYKHGSELFKKDGDIVLKGEMLGIVGNTGLLSTGPHLHFELWKNGISVNPLNYLIK